MPNADLGQARDAITEIERTSGTGAAGTVDTYSVWTETHPKSGGTPAGTFQVRNGANGSLAVKQEIFGGSGQTLSDLTNWIDGNSERSKRIVSMVYVDTSVNPCDIREVSYLLDLNGNTFKFFKTSVSSNNQEYIEITSLGGDAYIYVYYYDSVEASIDTELDASSTNPVENAGIVEGISAHTLLEEFDNLDEVLDGALAYLKTNVAKDVKKVYCAGSDSGADYLTAVWYEGNFDTNVYILRYSVYNQTAGLFAKGVAIGNTGSWVKNEDVPTSRTIAGLSLGSDITKAALNGALTDNAFSDNSENPVQNKIIVDNGLRQIIKTKSNLLINGTKWFAFEKTTNNLATYQHIEVKINTDTTGKIYAFGILESNAYPKATNGSWATIFFKDSNDDYISGQSVAYMKEDLGNQITFSAPIGAVAIEVWFTVNNGTASGTSGETIYWNGAYLYETSNESSDVFAELQTQFIQPKSIKEEQVDFINKETNYYTDGRVKESNNGQAWQAVYKNISINGPKTMYLYIGKSNSPASSTIAGLFAYDSGDNQIYSKNYGKTVGKFVEFELPSNCVRVSLYFSVNNGTVEGEVGDNVYWDDVFFGENDCLYTIPKTIKPLYENANPAPIVEDTFELSLPTDVWVASTGHNVEIYNSQVCMCKNIKDYFFKWSGSNVKCYERKVVIPPQNSNGTATLSLNVYNGDFELVASGSITVHYVVPSSSLNPQTTKRILCIGDSLTDLSTWRTELLTKLQNEVGSNFEYIGTLGTAPYLHEGHSGWSINSFLTNSAETWKGDFKVKTTTDLTGIISKKRYTSNNGSIVWEYEKTEIESGDTWVYLNRVSGSGTLNANGTLTEVDSSVAGPATIAFTDVAVTSYNPFYNPNTQSFDIEYYLTQTEQNAPDYIFLMVGTNGLSDSMSKTQSQNDADSNISQYKTIIDNIITKLPNCKIYVAYIHYWADQNGFGHAYGTSLYSRAKKLAVYEFNKKLKAQFNGYNANLVLVPVCQTFDSEYNFNNFEQDVNPFNSAYKTRVAGDAVHPSVDGFKQMAEEFYSMFIGKLS